MTLVGPDQAGAMGVQLCTRSTEGIEGHMRIRHFVSLYPAESDENMSGGSEGNPLLRPLGPRGPPPATPASLVMNLVFSVMLSAINKPVGY